MVRQVKEWLLGNYWLYNWIRPLVLGGFDFSRCYQWLEVGPEDVVVDIGCGFGQSLTQLGAFQAYHGFDIDARAIQHCRQKFDGDGRITLYQRNLTQQDLESIRPTKVLMMGLLHHLTPEQALQLLGWLSQLPGLRKSVTQDPVYLPGKWINNLIGRLDRGRFVQDQQGYERLVELAGLSIQQRIHCASGTGWAHYFCLGLGK